MRFGLKIGALLVAILPGLAMADPPCISKYSQLNSPFLSFKNLLGDTHSVGLINKTQGSFVWVEVREDEMFVTLYSTGPFELFGIRKQSHLSLCQGPEGMILEAFGQKDGLHIADDRVEVGDGSPKKSFRVGEMTPNLLKFHKSHLP